MSDRTRVIVEADGGSRGNPGPAGYGAVVMDAESGAVLAERAASIGSATNNVAEYGGLIAGLQAALSLGATHVEVRMDSKLVVEQMSGRWKVKHPSMQPLARQAAGLVREIGSVRFTWIPRKENEHADRLANEAMDAAKRGEVWRPGGDTGPADEADTWLAEHDPELAPVPEQPAANRLSGWQADPGIGTTTLLLRHGQTALSVRKCFSGVGDPELTEVGLAQAEAAAERLKAAKADVIVCSPLRRARQTAEAVALTTGLQVHTEQGLRETDFGDWDGYTFAEIEQRWPEEMKAWLASTAVAPPYGESFDDTAVRVAAARDRIVATHAGKRIIVVSHVSPIKTLVRLALGAPPEALFRLHLDLVALSEIQWFADGPAVLRSLNDTAHWPETQPGQ